MSNDEKAPVAPQGPEVMAALLTALQAMSAEIKGLREDVKKPQPMTQREAQDSLAVGKSAMKRVWETDLSKRFKSDVPYNLKDVIGFLFSTVQDDVDIACRTLSIQAAVAPFVAPALYPERGIGESWAEKRPAELKQAKLVRSLLQEQEKRAKLEVPGQEFVPVQYPRAAERKTDEQLAHDAREKLEAELASTPSKGAVTIRHQPKQ